MEASTFRNIHGDPPERNITCDEFLELFPETVALQRLRLEISNKTLYMTDNQRRWLILGIFLNEGCIKIIRPFVEQEIQREYRNLQTSHHIHTQSSIGRLQRHPEALKYENINGNDTLPRTSSGKYDYFTFDCRVKSHIDFAKLYVEKYAVKFNAFDEHCDTSALLKLLIRVPVFPPVVRAAARNVKQVRNSWAYGEFDKCDQMGFQQSLDKLKQLVKELFSAIADKDALQTELDDWEKKAYHEGIDALLYGLEQPERRLVIFRGSTVLPRELSDLEKEVLCAVTFPIPDYIKVRGPVALEAYRRALETGKTFDRRTKIVLIGQDRVGKTSLRRYLRGEAFVKDEASTNGIEMISPVKNAGKGAWRNPALLEKTSALDHKCAELVTQELRSSSEERLQRIQGFAGKVKETRGEPTGEKGVTQERSNDDLASKEVIERKVFQGVKIEGKPEEVPKKVLSLVERGLKGNDTSDNENIWPFVWDFAGQAVYHAIHPIFLSEEAIYVLVLDLTKELSAPAQCRIRPPRPPNQDEIEVNSPYVEDTNLDHMMRWLDLVHSLGQPEFQGKSANIKDVLPPVVLVGTHADGVRDPCKEMESVNETICSVAHPATLGHISKEVFFMDNTNPNREDDPQIVSLRVALLNLAKKMPHINKVIPMQWLRVEQKVDEMVKEKGMHYIGKKRFAEDISGGICQFNGPDDVEELLHFLQARGRVIYQDLAENPDGLVVLDPQWLIKILCEIITVSPSWKNDPIIKRDYQVLRKKGLLSQRLLNQAFEHLELNDIKDSLIHIMESFDVICNSKNCKGKDYPYFVPCMLKSPKKNTRGTNMRNGPLPVFLTFNTNYVPSGLFCRLVVHFWEWASQLCGSCTAPSLFSNAARFNVSEEYQLTLECHKTVIELKIWTPGDSNKTEEERICEELLSHLKHCRTRLSVTCPWLRSVTMELFVKCQLCEPCPDKCPEETNICILHKKEGCSHFDCGHYIPLRSLDLSCEHSVDAVPYPAEKLDPWFQTLKSPGRKKRTGDSTEHLRRSKVKRRDEESSPRDALTPKKRKTLFAGGTTHHFPRPKVKHRKEESSQSDALTPKKRKTLFAGGSTKHLRRSKVNRPNKESSPSDALTSKKRKTGFAGGSKKHLRWSKVKRRNEESSPSDALTSKKRKTGFAGASTKHLRRSKVKRRNEESSPSDALTSKKRKTGFAGGSTKHLPRPKVKRRNEELSPSDALTSKKRKSGFAGGSTKHLRRSKVKRRNEESSPSVALTSKKRKTGFAVKQGVLSDEDLQWLSHELIKWRDLGFRLKIREATLTEIDHDHSGKRKKIYEMLKSWTQTNGAAATYMVLHDALCHPLVGRTDLAEKFCCQPHE